MRQWVDGVRLRGLSIALLTTGAIGWSGAAWSQSITLDGTLGPQEAIPTFPAAGLTVYDLEQRFGTTVGQNLFHSFRQFNLQRGEAAFFRSNAAIRNILARVTGGARSEIDGLIATQSQAVNLFLINPSGILFGRNAQLDVGSSQRGSFVTTTTDAMVWPDGSRFSATNPNSGNSLLRIVGDPSGFLAARRNLQPVQVQGSTLQVYSGQSLLLLGGDVQVNNGNLFVDFPQGGRIEVGSVASPGTVNLRVDGNLLSLGLPATLQRGDVTIANQSRLDATAADRGDIAIRSRNLTISNSRLRAGIAPNRGTSTSQAGNVTLDATGQILIEANSLVASLIFRNATGRGGNVQIQSDSLTVTGRSQIAASTIGTGNAGNVIINARDRVVFSDGIVFSSVEPNAIGNGGDIRITTPILEVLAGGQLLANTRERGNAGNVIITASDRVTVQGGSPDGFGSVVSSRIDEKAVGTGGDVRITTPILEVLAGGQLVADTAGRGNAGNVIINARDRVLFSGTSLDGQTSSAAFSSVGKNAIGNGGDVRITTPILEVLAGGQLLANIRGRGNAGNVIITARNQVTFRGRSADGEFPSTAFSRINEGAVGTGGNIEVTTGSLEVTDGATLEAGTLGQGRSGNVIITAHDRVLFSNGDALSNVGRKAVGDGGDIRITTPILEVLAGGQLVSDTAGRGNAGNVIITASDRVFFSNSNAFSSVNRNAIGNGGDIRITTNILEVLAGGQLLANTRGRGNAGNVIITASDRVSFRGRRSADGRLGSAAFSSVESEAIGNGGNVQITAANLEVTDGALLTARSLGQGNAGNIILTTPRLTLRNRGQIEARSSTADGGNITLNIGDLLLMRQNSQISATAGLAGQDGNGGNITINAPNGFLVTAPNENNDITANAFNGSGGRVTVNAQGIYWFTPRSRAELVQLLGTNNPNDLDPQKLPTNDITAISQGSPTLSGTVTLNVLGTDPSKGFLQLPVDLVDAANQLYDECSPSNLGKSSFTYTGRGGIPESPDDPIRETSGLAQWILPPTHPPTHPSTPSATSPPEPIIEADRLVTSPQGTAWLVASGEAWKGVPVRCLQRQ